MPTVGEILATERRRQGKSLADVVEGTKIRTRMIDALEHGDYEHLPSSAYVKGYIQSYARFLEIPSEPLLEQYRRELTAAPPTQGLADRYLGSIPADTVVPHREAQHAIPVNVWVTVVVGVVLVLLLACGISRLFSGGGSGTSTPPAATGAATTDATASPGATAAAEPTVSITTTGERAFKVRVSVREGLASFVRAEVDGLKAYEGTLQGGDSREWLVSSTVKLTVGKPAAVVVTRDGAVVRLPATTNAKITLSATE